MAAPRAVPLTELEKEVLGWLFDDYESARSITNDIGRELQRPMTETDIAAALRALVEKGFALAFRYNKDAKAFEPVELRETTGSDDIWFLASPRGRTEIDQAAI
jgi:hypothetical protein